MMEPTKLKILERIGTAKTRLRQSDDNCDYCDSLKNVKILLANDLKSANGEQREFMQCHYAGFLQFLLEQLSVDWLKRIPSGSIRELFDSFFLDCDLTDSFQILCKTIQDTSPGYKLNKCVSLLEKILSVPYIVNLIMLQCEEHAVKEHWDGMVMYIATIPDRVINKLQKQAGDFFFPQNYIPHLCTVILHVLKGVHSRLLAGNSSRVEFLSLLIGRLAMVGHADIMFRTLVSVLTPLANNNPIWARVTDRLIADIPQRYLHSVISSLVSHIPWYGYMVHFLSNQVLTNHKMQFILTQKMLLHSYTDKDIVLQNILGYLSSSGTLRPLFIKVVLDMLTVWSDSSAIKHTSYEQHLYLSRALMVAMAFVSEPEKEQFKQGNKLIHQLMLGVQNHLDCGQENVRVQGMVVAESITNIIDSHGGEKLTFEYEETEEVKRLKSLLIKPAEPCIKQMQREIEDLSIKEGENDRNEEITNDAESELDSDDDLEPYDMSHDKKEKSTD